MKYYTIYIILNIIKIAVNQSIIHYVENGVMCHSGKEGWCFDKCLLTTPIFMTHVLTTM